MKFYAVTFADDPSAEEPVTPTLTEVATGNWQYRELAGLNEGDQIVTFELPAAVREVLQDKVLFEFEDGPYGTPESALDNYPAGVQYLIAEYNDELVQGSYAVSGSAIKQSGYVFNQVAGEAIVAAFDSGQVEDLPLIRRLAASAQSGIRLRPAQALLCEPASFNRNSIGQRTFTIVNNYCRAIQRSAVEVIAAQQDDLLLPEVARNAEVEEFIRTEQVSDQSWYYGFAFDSRIQQLTFNEGGSLSVADVDREGATQDSGITGSWTLENGKLHVVANIPAIGDQEASTLTRIIELMWVSEVDVEGVQTEVFVLHELLNYSSDEEQDAEQSAKGRLIPAMGSPSLNGLRQLQNQLGQLIPQ